MSDCIFCKIARGEIEVSRIHEDDHVVAFDDIAPQAPVHSLVIPRKHYDSLNEDVPVEELAALLRAARQVARIKGIANTGYRLIVNTGPQGGQTVDHLHVHVLGGRAMPEGMVRFDEERR